MFKQKKIKTYEIHNKIQKEENYQLESSQKLAQVIIIDKSAASC